MVAGLSTSRCGGFIYLFIYFLGGSCGGCFYDCGCWWWFLTIFCVFFFLLVVLVVVVVGSGGC